ncbi:hypothetical protein LJR219_004300 [Phenylobacterium sp. LjRoot219]|uniref:Kelch repeat-containing protein n=1 Tax=Phenylobacterium sp. LjRoot219 TaxID=3342283 RepID=UPI003ECF1632
MLIDRRTLLLAGLLGPVMPAQASDRHAPHWEAAADVPWPVQEVYGAAFNGKVVIAGGMAPSDASLKEVNPQDRTGVYDPATGRWREGPRLPFPRHHPALAATRGRLYAFGGYRVTEAGSWIATRDVLALDGKAWTAAPEMPRFQCETVAVALGGRIHLASGRAPSGEANRRWTDHGDVDLHQVFDTKDGRWRLAAPCPSARNSATGAVIDGMFYLAGGRTVRGGNSAQLDRYDPKTDRWEKLRPMPRAAGGLAGAAANGKLYVFGGEGGRDVIADCWGYDPATDQWTPGPAMRTPRHGLAAAAVNGRIYAVGGGLKVSGGQVCAVNEVLLT